MDPEVFDKFVIETAAYLKSLRSEAAKFRRQRTQARAEVELLKAENDTLRAELKAGRL